jgi:hypothetical protein
LRSLTAEQQRRRAVRDLQALGYNVTLEIADNPAA